MVKLKELAKKHRECVEAINKVKYYADYYEGMLLEYKGVPCYVEGINLMAETVTLYVAENDSYRFEGNTQEIKISLDEFDKEVTIIKEC